MSSTEGSAFAAVQKSSGSVAASAMADMKCLAMELRPLDYP
jgi:hypothetical protein